MPHEVTARAFRRYVVGGLVAFFAATLLLLFYPKLDLHISRLLIWGDDFIIRKTYVGYFLRHFFMFAFGLSVTISVLMVLYLVGYLGVEAKKLSAKWIFVLLCLSVGPGLIANLTFKSNWGRARPYHLEEFGGKKQYSPPLVKADQCQGGNCSFFSGEASNMFALFFALTLIAPALVRRQVFIIALMAGTAAGLVRMGQGAHFFSDVVFAGIFMWLTALAMWWLVFRFFAQFDFARD